MPSSSSVLSRQVFNLFQDERTITPSDGGFCRLTVRLAWLVRWLSGFGRDGGTHLGCRLPRLRYGGQGSSKLTHR